MSSAQQVHLHGFGFPLHFDRTPVVKLEVRTVAFWRLQAPENNYLQPESENMLIFYLQSPQKQNRILFEIICDYDLKSLEKKSKRWTPIKQLVSESGV